MIKEASLFLMVVCLAACSGVNACSPFSSSDSALDKGELSMSDPYLSAGLDRPGIKDHRVVDAMSRIPRHMFVPEEIRERAYEDRALSIGLGQTISQPFIVALMTQEANISQGSKVLEIGTGSGYQAAVLSELGATVYSIEIIPELTHRARDVLKKLGYEDIHFKVGDGWLGWPEYAPFDAIVITAACPSIPSKLLEQLAHRGRMVVPVEGDNSIGERLIVIERDDEDFITRDLGAVRFVPMTGSARD